MRSKSTNLGGIAKIYQVSEILSTSFTVNWIFILDDSLLNKYQKIKIGGFYENSLRNEKKDGKISFNPLGYSKDDFFEKIKKIKNKNGLIKVAADSLNAYSILNALRQQKQLDLITQFYVFPLIRAHEYLTVRLKDQFPSLIKFSDKVDQIVRAASDEIQKWRLKFQILRNFLSLSGASQERAYQWRIRLRACNNLKPAKYHQQLAQFEKFIADQIQSRKIWDGSYQDRASSKRTMIIQSLKTAIQKITLANEIAEAQQKAKIQDEFVQIMLKLYKDQTIFYEIINEGLKRFIQKYFQWERFALPLCLMTKAIKMSYQDYSRMEVQQKNRYFTVWRGGKISEKQLSEIISNWQNIPFYQFFSFVSTSKNINVALNFMKSTKKQVKKYNCLFKFQVRRRNGSSTPIHQQFFNHGYCSFSESIDKNEQQVLLNALTVGKIIGVEQLSWNQLKTNYNISKNVMPEGEQHQKIPLITIQIGSFEDLFTSPQTATTLNQQRKKNQDKIKYKSVIQHYIYTIEIIKKYQYFDFADAYELCNQMEKSYRYLQREVKQMVQKFSNLTQTPDEQKIRLVYEQSDYYSRLSDICRKLGKLSEALLYNENAIERIKQFQNIDKNKSYQLYQEKLNKMYLKSSHILIESHQYSQASRKIQSRIQELKQNQDKKQIQRNKVIISRLLLDLGVTNFKQGKLKQAEQIFAESAQNIQKIYEFINYDFLNEETHYLKWLVAVFNDPDVSIVDGPQVYFNKVRTKNIDAITAVYGGEERLKQIKKSAKSLELQTSQVIVNHKEYFCDAKQYEQLINEIQQKVDQKLKNQQKNIPQQIFLGKNKEQLSKQEQLQLVKTIKEKQTQNHYNRMKEEMNKQLLYEQKENYNEIMQQQTTILNQKKEIQKLRQTFWDNPNIYLDRIDQFKEQFNDLYLKKQEINREKLLMLQSNDQITMQQLTQYYKNSAKSINNYIKQLQRLGYSQSTPKVLQQYNNLIKLYIEINYSEDAKEKIQEVKRLADIKGQQKYYEMAVAYLRNAKIHASAAEIDFLIILEPLTSYRYEKMKSFRKQKVETAIKEFEKAQGYFRNALIKNQNNQQNRSAYEAEPQQFQLQIWIAKSYLIKCELSQQKQSRQLLKNIDRILGTIYSGLKKLNHKDKFQLHAETLQVEAIYHFRRAQYKKSLECFDECIKIRIQKFGDLNWQNTLTFIKVIYLFYMVESMQQRLMKYIQNLQKNYNRYKNYPFYWKICLAHYYMSKQCQNHQVQHAISYIQDSLIFMEKIGFAEEHFYRQYQLIYDIEYSSFYNNKKPYLNRPKLSKKQRNLKKDSKEQRDEEDPSFNELLQFTESNMMKSNIRMRKNKSSYTNETMNASINNNPENYLNSRIPVIMKKHSQLPPIQVNFSFYDSGMSSGIKTRDSSGRTSKRQSSNKSGMSNTIYADEKQNPRRKRQGSAKKANNYLPDYYN